MRAILGSLIMAIRRLPALTPNNAVNRTLTPLRGARAGYLRRYTAEVLYSVSRCGAAQHLQGFVIRVAVVQR